MASGLKLLPEELADVPAHLAGEAARAQARQPVSRHCGCSATNRPHAAPLRTADRYETQAARYWDRFYRRNADRFFKDRHYLHKGAAAKGPQPLAALFVLCEVLALWRLRPLRAGPTNRSP
jgi:hypothetical protein